MLTTNKLLNPARGSGRSGADVTAEFCKKLKGFASNFVVFAALSRFAVFMIVGRHQLRFALPA
jgi:hypothetical protein